MTYQELKDKHTKEFSAVPIFWAFSNEQWAEAVKKNGITKEDKIVSIGAGGYIKKSDVHILDEVSKKHKAERKEFKKQDKELIKAIEYELSNHEYGITMDPTDTIDCLSLDMTDERIQKCFKKAKSNFMKLEQY